MTGSTFITFRGEEDVEIEYDYSEDWQDDYCTGCEVQWGFADPAMKDTEVTPEEDEAVNKRIVELVADSWRHDPD